MSDVEKIIAEAMHNAIRVNGVGENSKLILENGGRLHLRPDESAAASKEVLSALRAAGYEVKAVPKPCDCGCTSCWGESIAHLTPIERMGMTGMIVCPRCGNKRCPHATSHENACTGSNEYGQAGSRYGGQPAEGEK